MSATTMVLTPRISEQTYQMSSDGVYVFNVPISSNKTEIKAAVAAQYDVTVEKVNVSVLKGKMKPSNRRGRRPEYGARKDVKKAYVTLKKGDKISVFEEVE